MTQLSPLSALQDSFDDQLFLQMLSLLQFEAAGRDAPLRLITESTMEEENLLQSWISLVQSFAASLYPSTRCLRGVDSPKLMGNLDHFLKKYSEEKFKSHFRVNKATYFFLYKNIKSSLEVRGTRRGFQVGCLMLV